MAHDIAVQIVDIMEGRPARYAINMPMVSKEVMPYLAPYINLGSIIGELVTQLSEGNIQTVTIKYEGEVSKHKTDALKASILGGLLESTSDERVNMINANFVAAQTQNFISIIGKFIFPLNPSFIATQHFPFTNFFVFPQFTFASCTLDGQHEGSIYLPQPRRLAVVVSQ